LADADLEEILSAMRPTLGDATIKLQLVEVIPPDPSGKRRLFVSRPDIDQSV
jgi:hypothetical protein